MSEGEETRAESVRPSRRLLLKTLVLPVVAAVVLVVGYFTVLPLDGVGEEFNIIFLLVWIIVVGVVMVVQARQIMGAAFPVLRAVGVLAIVLPAYLVGFAAGYYLLAQYSETSFGGSMTRMAALYFTVTVFATVGFGDIHAQDDTTMAVVTVQMLLNLLLLAVGVRAIFAAAKVGRARRDEPLP